MVYRNFLITFILIIVLLLSSCWKRGARARMLNSNEEVANNRMELVIKAIKNRDKDGLKAMFSKQVLREVDDINGEIDYLFNFFEGDVVSWKSTGGLITDEENNYGHKIEELKSFFYVDTDKQKYKVFLLEYLENTDQPDNVGLYTLRIIKTEDEETQWGYWQDMKIAGIYRPSIKKLSNPE